MIHADDARKASNSGEKGQRDRVMGQLDASVRSAAKLGHRTAFVSVHGIEPSVIELVKTHAEQSGYQVAVRGNMLDVSW